MSKEQESIRDGVTKAWDFWLSQHDVSTPELIHLAVKDAVKEWMDENEMLVAAALADHVLKVSQIAK